MTQPAITQILYKHKDDNYVYRKASNNLKNMEYRSRFENCIIFEEEFYIYSFYVLRLVTLEKKYAEIHN